MDLRKKTIAVIGLGYVGLPLAVEFGKVRSVIGFDVSQERIAELRSGIDRTREVEPEELVAAHYLTYTTALDELRACQVFIVAVPTPIDQAKRPDITLLKRASETVGKVIRPGGVVIFESTVYPGCTRNDCVPIIERESGLAFNRDFFAGYSPERINPGDKEHRLPSITKVTSGSTPKAADAIDELYGEIIEAGTHKAASIEVAEAAKVIENTQRDLNIALMNELAIIFYKLNIDTQAVLAAAGTKWNFLPFTPGPRRWPLHWGRSLLPDAQGSRDRLSPRRHPGRPPYQRRYGALIADRVARLMMNRGFPVVGWRMLVMGVAFKENCPDVRNSKVIDVIHGLQEYNAQIEIWDPWADADEARHEYGIDIERHEPARSRYDAVVMAVAHCAFQEMGARKVRALGRPGSVFFDLKGVFDKHESDGRL